MTRAEKSVEPNEDKTEKKHVLVHNKSEYLIAVFSSPRGNPFLFEDTRISPMGGDITNFSSVSHGDYTTLPVIDPDTSLHVQVFACDQNLGGRFLVLSKHIQRGNSIVVYPRHITSVRKETISLYNHKMVFIRDVPPETQPQQPNKNNNNNNNNNDNDNNSINNNNQDVYNNNRNNIDNNNNNNNFDLPNPQHVVPPAFINTYPPPPDEYPMDAHV